MDKEDIVYIYIYSGILFSLEKGNPAICNNMDGTSGHKSEKKKNTIWHHLYMESKKNLNSEKQRIE